MNWYNLHQHYNWNSFFAPALQLELFSPRPKEFGKNEFSKKNKNNLPELSPRISESCADSFIYLLKKIFGADYSLPSSLSRNLGRLKIYHR